MRFLWWVPLGLLVPGISLWRVGRRVAALATWVALQGTFSLALLGYGLAPARWVWAVVLVFPVYLLGMLGQAVVGAWLAKAPVARWWSVLLFAMVTGGINSTVNLLVSVNRLESYSVPSESMLPSLVKGDQFFVLLDDERYPMTRGAPVVYLDPNTNRSYVKRLIGFAGERVSWDGATLSITMPELPDEPVVLSTEEDCVEPVFGAGAHCRLEGWPGRKWRTLTRETSGPVGEWEVPDGHVFVLGDNRANSLDSRAVGAIPSDWLVGTARVIHWSWPHVDRVGALIDPKGNDETPD